MVCGGSTGPTNGSRSEKVWEPLLYGLLMFRLERFCEICYVFSCFACRLLASLVYHSLVLVYHCGLRLPNFNVRLKWKQSYASTRK